MNLDSALFFLCNCAEISVIGFLLYRRVWRSFPFFFTYSIWSLLSNAAVFVVLRRYSPASSTYLSFYLAQVFVDSSLLFAALVELALAVLRPLHSALPRKVLVAIPVLILLVGAAIWPFADLPGMTHSSKFDLMIHLKQTVAILAVLIFLALAAGSQFLAISWRDRELQIASGLGLYSLAGALVAVLHTHFTSNEQYGRLEEILVASYLLSLLYWIYAFAHQEEERRQLSPQAQNLLLAMAGAARSTHVALANSQSDPRNRNRDR